MTAYKRYRNFQCPTCQHNDSNMNKCMVGARYKFGGVSFRGTGTRPCPDYKRKREVIKNDKE